MMNLRTHTPPRRLRDIRPGQWNRRSGALFAFACQQLRELRAEQNAKAKAEREQQEEQERKAA